jgi:hypothetical protein
MISLIENDFPREDLNYKAFLVRIWRSGPESPWRAFTQNTMSGEQRYFSSLENLFLFLYKFTTDQVDPET